MPTESRSGSGKRLGWLAAAWLLLLLFSGIVRSRQPDPGPQPGQQVVQLRPVDGSVVVEGDSVQMAYYEDGSDSSTASPDSSIVSIVLLHGSPAASSFMLPLHEELVARSKLSTWGTVRIITPDLPGFGGSSRDLPDYSIRAHAAYLGAFLDSLGISRVHLAGYSMGAGVAIEAMRQWPERIESVSLIAGIGVQEMELLGDYHLNHGIHGLQLGALWSLIQLTPHFGLLDHRLLGLSYARNFYDSDQRPLREALSLWDKPMLLLHGNEDLFVPVAAALEHHRIVPQSELEMYPDVGHALVITEHERISRGLSGFVERVEAGEAPTRMQASASRLEVANRPFDPSDTPPATGFSLLVLAFLIALSTLVSEDLASITAGLMAARGIMPLGWALGGAFAGILVGDVGLYLMGRILGRRVITLPPFSWFVSANALERGARWFEQRGARIVVTSRFVPGTRFPTYVAAGIIRAPFWPFLGYFMLGTLLWTPFIVGLSMLLGERILSFWQTYESAALLVLAGLILTLYLIFHVGMPLLTYRGRRLWLSRWRRWTRWEFWPPWLFYPPVLWRILRLMIRHRSMTIFTAANPGMMSGGFVGESKAETFGLLPPDVEVTARWILVDPALRDDPDSLAIHVLEQLADENMRLPLVLKPDVGERGHGVHIVRTEGELRDALPVYPARFIVQEYVEGDEFGLFYVRHPAEPKGRIFSITHKQLPFVVGDGRHTLERLILGDDRAVCMAPTFLKRHAARLDHVPAPGERIQLVSVGTHARGALFIDGSALLTPELEEAVDAFARRMAGFHFGRFDVRVPDTEDLKAGRHIKILEINGVTSEATHVYDPSTPLSSALRVLGEQWRLAFEIGRANAELGAQPTSVSRLIRLIITWKIRPAFRPDTRAAAEWKLHSDATIRRTNETHS